MCRQAMMRRSCYKTIILAAAAILLSGLFLYIYATTNPESSRLFPKCIFLQLTGLRCPGCGSQRVVHSLLNGDVAAAFRYNAFLVLMIPYVSVLAFATFFKNRVPGFTMSSAIQPSSWQYSCLRFSGGFSAMSSDGKILIQCILQLTVRIIRNTIRNLDFVVGVVKQRRCQQHVGSRTVRGERNVIQRR